ncbi:PaaI family thioesterase [Profundibacterium mesophilum]|nr:PaaI family thioesterase [Profundibacterium mesophilum]
MMHTLGAELTVLEPGHAVIEAPLRAQTAQQHGAGHAGLAFSIGDSAAGYAALTGLPEDREVMTSEMKIHLLAPALGTHLTADGRVVKAGRRLIVVSASVYAWNAGERRQVALLLGTMVPVAP